EGGSVRLVLGRDELARELVAVLEVVRDGRVDAPIDGFETVVPPGQERGPEFGRGGRVLRGEPLPGRRIIVRRLRDAVPERSEVEGAAIRVVRRRTEERGQEVRDLLIVMRLEPERDGRVDRPPHVREDDQENDPEDGASALRRGPCHSTSAIAARLTPNVATSNDRMIWDIPGDWSSAMVVTTFVWTKYPAPVKKALARVGFTRTPTPSPTPAAINVLGMTSVQG